MPGCVMFGCKSQTGRDKISFFGIPSVITSQCDRTLELSGCRRQQWISRINRSNLTEENITRNKRVCSLHFVHGKPSNLMDDTHVDWASSFNLGYETQKTTSEAAIRNDHRYERAKARRLSKEPAFVQEPKRMRTEVDDDRHDLCVNNNSSVEVNAEQCGEEVRSENDISPGVSCQTDLSNEDYVKLEENYKRVVEDNIALREKVSRLKARLSNFELTEEVFAVDEKKIQFYTGLPTFTLLMHVFNFVSVRIESSHRNVLSKFSEYILVLMRLRLHLLEQDLAYRFGIGQSTVSAICDKWIRAMAARLDKCIVWPERETLRKTMPVCFKESFGDSVCVIIDCFEVFINRPISLIARAGTWSNYKHHNTFKFLIGITPQGCISFISKAWVGRASDQFITRESGILEKLLPGDVVLADRGFDIAEDVGMYRARLHIPAFTKGKTQLSSREVSETRSLANVRVEQMIGLLKRKYGIMQGPLPFEFLKPHVGDTLANVDVIARACCALTNLCPKIFDVAQDSSM